MAEKFTIQIESILGGHAPTTHFSAPGQFRASMGIDPAQPIDDDNTQYSSIASGLLRPSASSSIGTTTSASLWFVPNPKDANVYVYDAQSSLHAVDSLVSGVTAIADAGELSNGLGNGAEYYDNYIYLSKNTTVGRYGPLSTTPTMNGDYWVTTLAKTALTNTTYPTSYKNGLQLPNHVLKRHSDGKLYIADVVGNTGTLHYIKTTKTTVEGDTNNGSTYDAVHVGYGLWPTAMESYGEELAIAFYEGSVANLRQARAKLAFWDTTSSNVNKLIWVEYPDQIITAIKNVNGILYVVSGNIQTSGFRITSFQGGYSFKEEFYSETGEPCLPGAVDALLNRFIFGTHTNVPETDGVVYSKGLQKADLGGGMFGIMRATGSSTSTTVTAVCVADNVSFSYNTPLIAQTTAGDGSTGATHPIVTQGNEYNNAPSVFWSGMFRVGSRFKITKLKIPLGQEIGSGMIVTPTIYVDNGASSFVGGSTDGLAIINNTNYTGKSMIVMKPSGVTGEYNFWLELRWTGSTLCTVALPITIEGEMYPNENE